MKVIAQAGHEDIATVYVGKSRQGHLIEFTESLQPPFSREEKWVLTLSSLVGCMVGCPMCDAGGWYKGKLSKNEIMDQIDYLVKKRFSNKTIPVKKLKIQFSRMGEPSYNPAVLEVLRALPKKYNAPGLIPSISTVAPIQCDEFLEQLLKIKNAYYRNGRFQLQFSIHTTDFQLRDKIIPIKKWGFEKVAQYGERYHFPSDRKITLNFALEKNTPLDVSMLSKYFDPKSFLIKLTPINPTIKAIENGIVSHINKNTLHETQQLVSQLEKANYQVILSIGELEENKIGSNCGQYIRRFLNYNGTIHQAYHYPLEEIKAG